MDLLYGMQQSQGHDLDTPGLHYYRIATQPEEGLTDCLPTHNAHTVKKIV